MPRIRNTNAQRTRWNSNASAESYRRTETAVRRRLDQYTRDGRPAVVWSSESAPRRSA